MKLQRMLPGLVAFAVIAFAAMAYAGPMHGPGYGSGHGSGHGAGHGQGTCSYSGMVDGLHGMADNVRDFMSRCFTE